MRLRLTSPDGAAITVPALVDSGADRSMFRAGVIELLGIDPTELIGGEAAGLGGSMSTQRLRTGDLTAQLAGLPPTPFALSAEFSTGLPVNLLGRSDFFHVFDVAFYEGAQELLLRDRRV